jgi:DNA-directed RNA polymerase II subunit RPB3
MNAEWEEPPHEGEPLDLDKQPGPFYYNVETVGGLEPDAIVQQGIRVLQQKLAAVIGTMTGDDQQADRDVDDFGPRSPDAGANGYGGGGGYGDATPFGGRGNQSAYGGGGTPYGATPYGQNGGGGGW